MANLVRFDPWGFMTEFDRLFEDKGFATGPWMPRVDVFEKGDTLAIRAELPGVDPADVEVTVEGGTLSISGTRSFETEETGRGYRRKEIFEGDFKRTIVLPEGTDQESIAASSHDGILEIVVPMKPEVLPRKVTVDVQR